MVGRLVQEEDVDGPRHQPRQFEAAALADREGADRRAELFAGEQPQPVEGFGVLFERAGPAFGEGPQDRLRCRSGPCELAEVADRCRQLGADVETWAFDLGDLERAVTTVDAAWERFGGLDVLVNNAAMPKRRVVTELDPAELDEVMRVNFTSPARMTLAVLPRMLARDSGVIVNVSSLGGRLGIIHETAYCASKFGVVGFTRALAAETAGRIGVTLLVPGGMRTAFFDGREERYRPPDGAQLNDPADVADAVVFALTRPEGCEVRELLIAPAHEGSWP